MLAALLPNQVSDHWELLKKDIENSLPPIADYGPYDLNALLYSCMVGAMQVWLVQDKEQKNKGFVTTSILRDVSGVSTLIIYNAIMVENTPVSDWASGYDTLVTFARSKGCAKIGAFVMNEKILAILKDHDFETRFVFAHKNI